MLAIGCTSIAWAVWLLVFGGFNRTVLGVRIRSNNPQRVLLVAAAATAGYFLAGGRVRPSRLLTPAGAGARGLERRPAWVAVGVAAAAVAVSAGAATRIAGGSDAYGYVSQAELWLARSPVVHQPWVEHVPWPNGAWTFSPLGYRPADHHGTGSIVPTYSPGLPMLMAAAKFIAGHCALFAVVPLSLAASVLATYGIGRRLGSPWAGVIGGWLVATSPVVLEVAVESLTDVPVMAAWALAFVLLMGRGAGAAVGSGLCAALAILIRPNLVPLAAPLGLWFLIRRTGANRAAAIRVRDAVLFALAVAPGIASVALINRHFYAAASASGYGDLGSMFGLPHVWPNLQRFVVWIAETQTPLAFLGLGALFVPLRRFWPAVPDRRIFAVIVLFVAMLWGIYSAYLVFDSPGYLRFLLPAWPLMFVALGSVLTAAGRAYGAAARWICALLAILLGAWNAHTAVSRGALDQRQAARHEAPIGRLVREHTAGNSVILAVHRSGSLRYYAGRITMRYDMLDPEWLDRSVAWFDARGVRVYAVLDEREAAEAKNRFASQRLSAVFSRPLLVYQPASTSLYDLSARTHTSPIVIAEALPDLPGCDPPAPIIPPVFR
jgi:4-amino-4-deoxy-L-arabinose transferase-like glycosyltransferase